MLGELEPQLVGATSERGHPLLRVLQVANEGCAEDVELSIRAELLRLLELQDCWFTTEPVTLTTLDPAGDAALPAEGVAVPVTWGDRCYGHLIAVPVAGRTTSARARRIAVAMAQTLGLSLAAGPAPA